MTKVKIEIGKAILTYLSIISDACNQENLFKFLINQRGYNNEEIKETIEQLVNYKLIVLYEQGADTFLYLTLDGNQASTIGLSAFINSVENKKIETKVISFLSILKVLKFAI